MSFVGNVLFDDCSFSSLPEIPPTIKKAVLVSCGVAATVSLGLQALRYCVRSVVEERIREKISDYLVIGFTRDEKLSPQELEIKGEAIAVRDRLLDLLTEIANQENPHLSADQQKDLSTYIRLVKLAFFGLDKLGPTNIEKGALPSWWNQFEPKIKAEIVRGIELRYAEDLSPEMQKMKEKQRNNQNKLIDSIFTKIIEKNKGLAFLSLFALEQALNALKK